MVSALAAVGFAYLCLAFDALDLSTFLNSQCSAGAGTTTSAEAPLLIDSAAEILTPLAALGVLFVALALIYHHMTGRRVVGAVPVGGAGDGRRSISSLLVFVLCLSAGTLEFILFGQTAGGAEDHGAQARALGLAALRALPAAATATFFAGMMQIIVGHVRAGGEGGGTGAAAGNGAIQGLLRVIPKVAAGAAAALVGLMAMALTLYGASKY